jgi:hypothetical protein
LSITPPEASFVCARSMRQRVFEQAEIAEVIVDAILERAQRLAEPPDFGGRRLVEVAGDEIAAPRRRAGRHADANSAWPNRSETPMAPGPTNARVDAMRVEQAADHLRLD